MASKGFLYVSANVWQRWEELAPWFVNWHVVLGTIFRVYEGLLRQDYGGQVEKVADPGCHCSWARSPWWYISIRPAFEQQSATTHSTLTSATWSQAAKFLTALLQSAFLGICQYIWLHLLTIGHVTRTRIKSVIRDIVMGKTCIIFKGLMLANHEWFRQGDRARDLTRGRVLWQARPAIQLYFYAVKKERTAIHERDVHHPQ